MTGHVRINAEVARSRARVVLLPHVREVDVSDLVLMVERYQQLAVADREVTGHRTESLSARGSYNVIGAQTIVGATAHIRAGRARARPGHDTSGFGQTKASLQPILKWRPTKT